MILNGRRNETNASATEGTMMNIESTTLKKCAVGGQSKALNGSKRNLKE